MNEDRLPDLYVCNDFHTPDRLWLNQGAGKFRIASNEMLTKSSYFSMAVDFADIDRDGYVDFFVADMARRSHVQRMKQRPPDPTPNVPEEFVKRPQIRQNTLWRNRGDGTFCEIAQYAGVAASDWSWTSIFVDVDLDGL